MVETRSARRLACQAAPTTVVGPSATDTRTPRTTPHKSPGPARSNRSLARSQRKGPYTQGPSAFSDSSIDLNTFLALTSAQSFSAASDGQSSRETSWENLSADPAADGGLNAGSQIQMASPPRPLSRSGPIQWTRNGPSMRLVVIEDGPSTAAAQAKQMQEGQVKQDRIFQRELYRLVMEKEDREDMLKEAELASTDEEEGMESEASSSSLSSQANRPRGKPLGPHGTELIFDHSLVGMTSDEILQVEYPPQWVAEPSNALRRRPTEPLE